VLDGCDYRDPLDELARDWPPDAILNDDSFALFRVPPSS